MLWDKTKGEAQGSSDPIKEITAGMIKYLRQNNTLYPEYLNFTSGIDTIVPDLEGYTTSLYLDDDSCYESKDLSKKYQGKIGC